MKKLNWLFLVLFAFAFISCDDDDDDVDLDVTNPTIMITSPTPNATFAPGAVVPIRANVEDDMGLDEVRVILMNPDNTQTTLSDDSIRDFLNDDREAEVDFDLNLAATQPAGNYTLMFEATDDSGNTAQQSVNFTVQ